MAGTPPERRVEHLRRFWEEITAPTAFWPAALGGPLAMWQQKSAALAALMFGQPGFFCSPRFSGMVFLGETYEPLLNPRP